MSTATRGVLLATALATGAGAVVADAALAWRDGVLEYVGPADGLPEALRGAAEREGVRANGCVVPGFVDCHTHLPFFGWRAEEFEARLAGRTYQDLQTGEGGGILRSSRLLNAASDEEVLAFCRPLAAEMLTHGTTTLELKTGYGLSVEAELRQAAIARRLAEEIRQRATVTLLACHAVPPGMERADWVAAVCGELIPRAAADGLCDAVDIYVEDIAFSVDDLRRVADAAHQHELPVRCHADQLGASGAAEVAVAVGARSADHLNHVGPEGVAALAGGGTTAVVLPTSTLFLRADPPPVADLFAAGARVAVATDFNPGTSPCLSMPQVIATACSLYGMSVADAIAGATSRAAEVLGMGEAVGALEVGRRADFVVLDAADPAMIPYRPGHNPVDEVWIGGERVHARAGAG